MYKIIFWIVIFVLNLGAQQEYQTTITQKNIIIENLHPEKKLKNKQIYPYADETISNTGIDTKIYGYWDYQSNGGAINYIDVNPNDYNNIHIVTMTSTDSVDPVAVSMSRKVMYNYSNDGGITWGNPVIVPNFRAGYPSLSSAFDLYDSYIAVIASHSTINGFLRSSLYIDDYEGAGNFFTYVCPQNQAGTDNVVGPLIAQTSNGNIVLAGSFPNSSVLSGISVIVFDFASRSWGNWISLENSPKHSGRIAVAAGGNGYVAVVWRSNTNPDSLIYRQSTNNGITWGNKTVIDFENGLTGLCWTGFDAIYKDTDLYVVFTKSAYNPNGYFLANRVCMWKSTSQNITTIIDSSTYPYLMKSTGIGNIQTNHNFAFNFPTVGFNADKTRIYVAVDAFLQNITDPDGFNYGEILLSYSDDDGNNWALPQNITRTFNVDERYVSISPLNPIINDSNYVYLVYQEDKIPGANIATNALEARQITGVKTKFMKLNTDFIPRGTANVNVMANWNMISIPVDTLIDKSLVFPNAVSNAFTLSSSGGYIIQNQLTFGKSYWLKLPSSGTVQLKGKIPNSLRIAVNTGWNMIGCYNEEIAIKNVTTTPPNIIVSKFYGYSNGYVPVDTLKPGRGYWVKVNKSGYINLVKR